ncbi:MAG: AAC(3) family N-acetyltransferase [Planctomycetota bacterium]|nr:AAC(3) family N-acetyltransferase [Planctomycetota bacterium]
MKKRKNADRSATVTKKNIIDGLKRLGLRSGDHVLVHVSLSSFGRVAGGADTVIDALLKVTGPDGTVVVPAFESDDEVFDAKRSKTLLGAVPQAFCKRKGAVRSRHPLASVAAIGKKAKWLIENHVEAKTAHGKGTPYYKLYELGGKVLLLGVDQDRSTFLHTAETLARLPYLKPSKAFFIDSTGKKKAKTWPLFAGPHRNFIGLQNWLEKTHLTRKTTIGPCVAQVMSCRELLDALPERLKTEPGLFISDNPNLPDGIWQKADVLRDQWRRCSFRLVADSLSAGQYAEEIIDNLTRFGIEHVLLSYVNDRPWDRIEQRKRKWYIQGFRRAKIGVSAVKATGVLSSGQAASLMKEAGTDTLIVPSTYPTDVIARFAADGLKVLVENTFIGSKDMGDMLEALPRKISGNVQLAFNPLGFVRVGENPFLTSFRSKIKRHIGLLYVNDGFATGRRIALEEGLSEIKELISALHCKGFGGLFVLQTPEATAFPQTVRKFMDMLEETGVV